MDSNIQLSDGDSSCSPTLVDIITIKNENYNKIQTIKQNISTIANKIDSLKVLINDNTDVFLVKNRSTMENLINSNCKLNTQLSSSSSSSSNNNDTLPKYSGGKKLVYKTKVYRQSSSSTSLPPPTPPLLSQSLPLPSSFPLSVLNTNNVDDVNIIESDTIFPEISSSSLDKNNVDDDDDVIIIESATIIPVSYDSNNIEINDYIENIPSNSLVLFNENNDDSATILETETTTPTILPSIKSTNTVNQRKFVENISINKPEDKTSDIIENLKHSNVPATCKVVTAKKQLKKIKKFKPLNIAQELTIPSDETKMQLPTPQDENHQTSVLQFINNFGENNETVNSSSPQRSPPQRSPPQRSAPQPSISAASSTFNELQLTGENLLLLELITMDCYQRDEYIRQLAISRNIVKSIRGTNRYTWNEKLLQLSKILKPNINHYLAKSILIQNDINQTFEGQINSLILSKLGSGRINKSFILDPFPIPNNNNNNKIINTFDYKLSVKLLQKFVDHLIRNKLGYTIEGTIRVSQNNFNESYLKNSKDEQIDINIPSILLRKCAMDGDYVLAFALYDNIIISPSSSLKSAFTFADNVLNLSSDDEQNCTEETVNPKGFVIKILRYINTRKTVGICITPFTNKRTLKFASRDSRLPYIQITVKTIPTEYIEKYNTDFCKILFFIEIIEWENEIPIGKIIEDIGYCDELKTEYKAILLNNDLYPNSYSDEILNSLPTPETFRIPYEEYVMRENLTKQLIFTIDPATAKDLDDAVSFCQLPNENYEIGVHISDVTYFFKENSELDQLLLNQTSSIYMSDKVYHMLPLQLCLLCSLLPGNDKLTYSIFFEFSKTGDLINYRIARTIINSAIQLSYDHASAMIENPYKHYSENDLPKIFNGFTYVDISKSVNCLNKIALKLRKKRYDMGSIKIEQPKIIFQFDKITNKPIGFTKDIQKASNHLIEEFMILANQTIAKFIWEKFPKISIIRRHIPPIPRLVTKLIQLCNEWNITIDTTSTNTIYKSLMSIINDCDELNVKPCILSIFLSKPFQQATYNCSDGLKEKDLHHFALAIPIYTHFTSPIRRYPDILVHRLLGAALELTPMPLRSPNQLTLIAESCNIHKKNAKSAQDECNYLYFLQYIKDLKTVTMRAAIFSIFDRSIEVILIESGYRIKFMAEHKSPDNFIIKIKHTKPKSAVISWYVNNNVITNSITVYVFSEIFVEVCVEKSKLKGRLLEVEK